jgi:hypothetical protein
MTRLGYGLASAAVAVVWAAATVWAQAPEAQAGAAQGRAAQPPSVQGQTQQVPGGRPGGPGGAAVAPAGGRAQAPFDITGYWVSLVTDDWRYRMLTPPKGNADYIPITPEARKVMGAWDPAKDEAAGDACRAYGAAGVMRLPGRLHNTWEGDNLLRIDTDAGTQTRRFHFGAAPAASSAASSAASTAPASTARASAAPTGTAPSWQGTSVARWQFPASARGRGPATTGQLVVTTTTMKPGYLRKNGVPYSANAVLTEYFVRLLDGTQEYLVVTTMVDDPQYLAQPYVKTYEYKKQADATGWTPTSCSAK